MERRSHMRRIRGMITGLPLLLLTACAAFQPEGPMSGLEHPGQGRILSQGDIQVAETRLSAFGYDPGPIDGVFTVQTQAAVRAFQLRYGVPVSGFLDRPTREELKLGVDRKRTD